MDEWRYYQLNCDSDRQRQQLVGFFVAQGQVKVNPVRIVVTITLPVAAARKLAVLYKFRQEFGGHVYTWSWTRGRQQASWELTRAEDAARFARFFIENCTLPTCKIEQCQRLLFCVQHRTKRKARPNLRLRQARKAAGLTQADLAQAAEVSTSTVCRWERYSVVPQLAKRRQVEKLLGDVFSTE